MAPVSIMLKPNRRASCRATVLLPAPAGPSMATMGALTQRDIPRAPLSAQRQEERHAYDGHRADSPRQPWPLRAIGLGKLLVLVAGHGRDRLATHPFGDQRRREEARPAQEEGECQG